MPIRFAPVVMNGVRFRKVGLEAALPSIVSSPDARARDRFREDDAQPVDTMRSETSLPLTLFLEKLRKWVQISAAEKTDLESAWVRSQPYNAGDIFSVQAQERNPLAVVQTGVAFAFAVLPSGDRHISNVFFPGDILTYQNFETGRVIHEFCFVTPGELDYLSAAAFASCLDGNRHIAQIISLCETARTLLVSDRFASVVRHEGEDRVLRLLLELKACEELASHRPYDEFFIPLTQDQIGDMIGLTSVYVSKILSRLSASGVIARQGKLVRFNDRSFSELKVGFINRYQQIKGWRRAGARNANR